MYIPLDPKKIDKSWFKLKESLLENKFYCSIHEGKYLSKNNTKIALDQLINKMKIADYIRLGSSRMSFTPAHFAINFLNHDKAKLVELISSDDTESTLKNELLLVIQFAFFENKNLNELVIPVIIDGISDPDVKIDVDRVHNQMKIRRCKI